MILASQGSFAFILLLNSIIFLKGAEIRLLEGNSKHYIQNSLEDYCGSNTLRLLSN